MSRFPFISNTPDSGIEVSTQEEADRLLEEWRQQHPFSVSGGEPKYRVKPAETDGGDHRKVFGHPAEPGTSRGPTRAPEKFVTDALKKKPGERTSAEVEAIKVRRRYEDVADKQGFKVTNSIRDQVTAEEIEPARARAAATKGVIEAETTQDVFAEKGYKADGTKMTPEEMATQQKQKAGAKPPAAGGSGGTITKDGKTTTVPASADAPPTNPFAGKGYAMRNMNDGSVRVASGLNQPVQSFDSREAALAVYRPSTPALQQPTVAGKTTPQPVTTPAPAAVQPPAQPQPSPAPQAQPVAAATPPAAPTGTADQTTSPTAKLGQAGTSVPTTPAKVTPIAPPPAAPVAAAQPAPASSGYATPFRDEQKAKGEYATGPITTGRDLAYNVFSGAKKLSEMSAGAADAVGQKIVNVFDAKLKAGMANREIIGAPAKAPGYQQDAEKLRTY